MRPTQVTAAASQRESLRTALSRCESRGHAAGGLLLARLRQRHNSSTLATRISRIMASSGTISVSGHCAAQVSALDRIQFSVWCEAKPLRGVHILLCHLSTLVQLTKTLVALP
jgi:hypothetical protein